MILSKVCTGHVLAPKMAAMLVFVLGNSEWSSVLCLNNFEAKSPRPIRKFRLHFSWIYIKFISIRWSSNFSALIYTKQISCGHWSAGFGLVFQTVLPSSGAIPSNVSQCLQNTHRTIRNECETEEFIADLVCKWSCLITYLITLRQSPSSNEIIYIYKFVCYVLIIVNSKHCNRLLHTVRRQFTAPL